MRRRWWQYALDLVIVLMFLACTLLPWGDWLGSGMSLSSMMQGPSWGHPLGTDNLGRDLLVRCSQALRQAVLPLWLSVLLASLLGFLAGWGGILLARARGCSPLSFLLQGSATVVASIPVGIGAFAWAAYAQEAGLASVLMAVSLLFFVRVFLQVLDLYRHDCHLAYWEAHHSLGGSLSGRVFRYGLGGTWSWRLAEGMGFHLRAAVAIEASLSYLGFGVQEPQASFGNMLASHFDTYLKGNFSSLLVIVGMLALAAAFPGALISVGKLAALLVLRSKKGATAPIAFAASS